MNRFIRLLSASPLARKFPLIKHPHRHASLCETVNGLIISKELIFAYYNVRSGCRVVLQKLFYFVEIAKKSVCAKTLMDSMVTKCSELFSLANIRRAVRGTRDEWAYKFRDGRTLTFEHLPRDLEDFVYSIPVSGLGESDRVASAFCINLRNLLFPGRVNFPAIVQRRAIAEGGYATALFYTLCSGFHTESEDEVSTDIRAASLQKLIQHSKNIHFMKFGDPVPVRNDVPINSVFALKREVTESEFVSELFSSTLKQHVERLLT
jgi:hypothetical protein